MKFVSFLLTATVLGSSAAVSAPTDRSANGTMINIPLFARTLNFRLPPGFILANRKTNDTNVLIEYVPKGQSVTNWTRLVTVQAYRGLGASPETSAQIAHRAFYPAACRIGKIFHMGPEQPVSGPLQQMVIANGCASLPAGAYPKALAGAGEQDFILMFRDQETIYTLNYAVRGASFEGKPPPVDVQEGKHILRETFGEVALNLH